MALNKKFWQGKNVLVTGGAGFIGSEIVRQLQAVPDIRITILDKMTYAADLQRISGFGQIELPPRISVEQVALEDAVAVQKVLERANPDYILHSAAESHVDRSIEGPSSFLESNVVGTFNLLQAALQFWEGKGKDPSFRLLHISTDEVYGSLGEEGVFSEQSPYDPRSPYAATKAASDHLVRAWHHTYEMPVLLTNCGNNYGYWQFPEKLIPLMILKSLKGEALPLYGSGKQIREWIHVSDHVRGLLAVLEKGQIGDTYLIGSGDELENRSVVEKICELMDRFCPEQGPHDRLITHVVDRPGHDKRYALDAKKIRRETSWRPKVSFEDGLLATVKWYLEQQKWWQGLEKRGYAGARLGVRGSAFKDGRELPGS
ncbi:dTDP-glucose 4,6-dehydratase [Kiloniella laminariae]|uniref:dTDP-glucose 4,6-dehydratase n=1 Tax=Kiloniella laminariae TaxID=454162 RepID=A0ABT4LKI8_9PROT|nr:dTDP-glucose 4,6-dehydratase [Kiloniella laminariae]MCZ4281619.1 dTDP-glucose 4,6-dehydratase [Kiloniella laminariae]